MEKPKVVLEAEKVLEVTFTYDDYHRCWTSHSTKGKIWADTDWNGPALIKLARFLETLPLSESSKFNIAALINFGEFEYGGLIYGEED